LPVIAQQGNIPLRSRSGSVQFGEAPPLPKANKPGMSHIGSSTHGFPEQICRPNTVDGGSHRRFLSDCDSTSSPCRVSPNKLYSPERDSIEKEDKCPHCLSLEAQHKHLEKGFQNKSEEVVELKNSIDRLNAQVSYHIFSNNQLQQEVDKLKAGGTPSGPTTSTKEMEKLRKELKEAADEKLVLMQQMKAKSEKQELALKQANDALKKAHRDLADARNELNKATEVPKPDDGAEIRKLLEVERTRSAKLQKELEEAQKNLKKAKGAVSSAASSQDAQIAELKARIKTLEAELKSSMNAVTGAERNLAAANARNKVLEEELEALRLKNKDHVKGAAAGDDQRKAELEKLQAENERLRMSDGMLKARVAALEKELEALKENAATQVEEVKRGKAELTLLRDELERVTATGDRHKKEVEELKIEITRLQGVNDAAADTDTKLQQLQEQIRLLLVQQDEMIGRYTTLEEKYNALQEEKRKLQVDYETECKRRSSLEEEVAAILKREREARSELENERRSHQKVVKEVEVRVKEVSSATKRAHSAEQQVEDRNKRMKTLDSNVKELELANRRLKDEMDALGISKDAMLEKANNALQRLKGQVLQMTCQGLLRLCVVAPRVTIAFEMKNINVAAVLPSGEIRAMLERELLPKYTKVFLQKEENRGPENEEMEKWLQELLRDMETKIEQKLVSVLNDSMPQGSVVSSSKD